jgi:hypothetical protein
VRLGGPRQILDARIVRRACEDLGLDWSELPEPKSRLKAHKKLAALRSALKAQLIKHSHGVLARQAIGVRRSVRNNPQPADAGKFALRPARTRVAGASSVDVERLCGALHDFPGDYDLLDAFEARQVEHGVEQNALHDGA